MILIFIGCLFLAVFIYTVYPAFEMMDEKLFLFILPFAIFWGFGCIKLIFRGLKRVRCDYYTSKNGEECFCILKEIKKTDVSINDASELMGYFKVYVPSFHECFYADEVIGFNPDKYSINTFFKCKYFCGDIKIIEVIDNLELIPSDIRYILLSDEEGEI